eukprot:GFUD01016185.1.p1 GENE.GFUD01016185.1~~GFUD01016185.1.p1  ORF type:complete len:356 (+),score=99.41 GFUD01016185.1:137-1204(+)
MGANEGKHDWFEQQFGFVENEMDGFKEVQKSFQFDKSTNILSSRANMRNFSVGLFETPSVKELQDKLIETSPTSKNLGGLTFQNIVGDATDLHLDQENAGSVFQVASQFNCLEMVGPDVTPEDGITIYAEDGTQGPRCAMACPAATVFRNYLWKDRGQAGGNNKQVNTAEDLGRLLGNEDRKYWNMKNGYMMPSRSDAMKEVGERISNEDGLRESLFLNGRTGIHWSTEVTTGSHQVTQVFCSAVPITYTQTGRGTKPKDWKSLAEVILESAYEATLLTGAILAGKREQRVTVFLTCLGGGAFGNPSPWICAAMEKALLAHVDKPLDVKLVNYARMPTDNFVKLESKVKRSRTNN